MNPICKNCGKAFPERMSGVNAYCSRECFSGPRITHAELLERARSRKRPQRQLAFDPGMVAFLIAMIGLCLEHACATCECWRAMALAWLECRECRGVGAWG